MSPPITPAPTTCTCARLERRRPCRAPSAAPAGRRCGSGSRRSACSSSDGDRRRGSPAAAQARRRRSLRPQLEDRVRRGVVLAPRALRHLLSRLRGDDAPRQRQSASATAESRSARGAGAASSTPRAVFSMMRARHALVDEAHALRAARVDRLAGQHQVERRGRADRAAAAACMPPHPGTMPSITSGSAKRVFGLVDDDAVAAGERQLQAAAQAEAADQRERRDTDARASRSNVSQPRLTSASASSRRLDVAELVDVGAGDEAVRLARADDEALRRLAPASASSTRRRILSSTASTRTCWSLAPALVEGEPREAVGVACPSVQCLHALLVASVPSTRARPASRRPGRRRCRSHAMPRRPPVRFSTFSRCSTIRAPDAPTGWPSAIAPPSTLSFVLVERAQRARQARAPRGRYFVARPRAQAGEHLRGERLVDFPAVEVVEAEAVALEDRRRGVHRAEAHLRRIERPPIASRRCGRSASGSCFVTASSEASSSHAAPSVICELLPARDVAVLAVEERLAASRGSPASNRSRTPSSGG